MSQTIILPYIMGCILSIASVHASSIEKTNVAKPPYNIILIISDQQAYHLAKAKDYQLPAHQSLKHHGVTFHHHYTAAAMCTPSRASFLTGTAPQTHGVFDQMEYGYVPNLNPNQANMGSVLKNLGYHTAYFGKFEMKEQLIADKPTVNYSKALQDYGFDVFNSDGDSGSTPQAGYNADPYITGEAIRWLHSNATPGKAQKKPFFMVVSLLNPHDIMYADANIPGKVKVQKPKAPVILPPPSIANYEKQWKFSLSASLAEPLLGPGMPRALLEYQEGWAAALGFIPTDRQDMWSIYYNYYLNAIRDNDRNMQELVDVLDELKLWENTVVIFTADHGEMGGAHGGLRGKGPMVYEENSHIPLIIAHPKGLMNKDCYSLTSHIDLLPTLIGLTGLPKTIIANIKTPFPGHDFSKLLINPENAALDKIRPAILFNYVGISTIDASILLKTLVASLYEHKPPPPLTKVNLSKRGFLSFIFDGRYKYGRYYAPNAFNAPKTFEDIFKYNDVQLFDLTNDPSEQHNLAIEAEKHKALILKMNALLNDLMSKEVGVNDGKFLPKSIRPS